MDKIEELLTRGVANIIPSKEGLEKKLRSGTENVSGIVGFAKAVEIADRKDAEKMTKIRDILIARLFACKN